MVTSDKISVQLTKTGWHGNCAFGRLVKGHVIDVRVSADIGGEQEAKIRARRMMERDHPDENQMEWEAEVIHDRAE